MPLFTELFKQILAELVDSKFPHPIDHIYQRHKSLFKKFKERLLRELNTNIRKPGTQIKSNYWYCSSNHGRRRGRNRGVIIEGHFINDYFGFSSDNSQKNVLILFAWDNTKKLATIYCANRNPKHRSSRTPDAYANPRLILCFDAEKISIDSAREEIANDDAFITRISNAVLANLENNLPNALRTNNQIERITPVTHDFLQEVINAINLQIANNSIYFDRDQKKKYAQLRNNGGNSSKIHYEIRVDNGILHFCLDSEFDSSYASFRAIRAILPDRPVEQHIPQGVSKIINEYDIAEGGETIKDTIVAEIVDYIKSNLSNMVYNDAQEIEIANLLFHTNEITALTNAIFTKPFIILSGVSGTGKTQLARAIAEAVVLTHSLAEPKRFEGGKHFTLGGDIYQVPKILDSNFADNIAFVPVRPDWNDNKKIWGNWNPFDKFKDTDYYKFYATDILRLAIRAAKNPDRKYFLILDEMNLARVEYYFSDILSLMESPEEKITLHPFEDGEVFDAESIQNAKEDKDEKKTFHDKNHLLIPAKIKWPENISIIGTVNVDETTFAFAPKVLDRAFVLEFLEVEYEHVCEGDLLTFCNTIKERLFPVSLHFGYRTVAEMKEYLRVAGDAGDTSFDFLLKSKVLPKLHGTVSDIESPLYKLFVFCLNVKITDELFRDYLRGTKSINVETTRYPQSANKILQMLRRLESTGTTAFF